MTYNWDSPRHADEGEGRQKHESRDNPEGDHAHLAHNLVGWDIDDWWLCLLVEFLIRAPVTSHGSELTIGPTDAVAVAVGYGMVGVMVLRIAS